MSRCANAAGVALLGWALAPGPVARAGPPPDEPAGTVAQDPATKGTTDLDIGKFAAGESRKDESDDVTQLELSAGGLGATGNARSFAVTGLFNFRLRRGIHQFSSQMAGNYGMAALGGPDSSLEPTVSNVQGRVRYDVFVHERVSLFAMFTARHDPFLGLKLRLNVDPGVAIYILTDPRHRLWTEVGYDFQYDIRTTDALYLKNEDGEFVRTVSGERVRDDRVDRTQINHAVRLFGGYENSLSDAVSFRTGLEYLQSVLVAGRWRLNWDIGLTAHLVQKLSLAATFSVRMDNDPLPGVRQTDTLSALSLVYTFF